MYRYSVDNNITYNSDDLVLFRESPFASWMERLTLENPAHGIPPDAGSTLPDSPYRPQIPFAATLRTSGRQFVQVDWDMPERQRRAATLEAMRNGADFIVDGHLAVGPLAGPVNLLMRTSGFSDLGDYLYIPCDTQGNHGRHGTFRLCFLTDLLHALQGQLPPQMLLIRADSDELSALKTEDHIHYYRAVKQRFMRAHNHFRKHRMPDPAESSHCGRWYDCANEVLRQRLLHRQEEPAADAAATDDVPLPLQQVVGARPGAGFYDLDSVTPGTRPGAQQDIQVAGTLAEQARQLGVSGELNGAGRPRGEAGQGSRLQPLAFIGESAGKPDLLARSVPAVGPGVAVPERRAQRPAPAPAPGLGDLLPEPAPGHSERWVVDTASLHADATPAPHPLDSPGFNISAHTRFAAGRSRIRDNDTLDQVPYQQRSEAPPFSDSPAFSERLNTSESLED